MTWKTIYLWYHYSLCYSETNSLIIAPLAPEYALWIQSSSHWRFLLTSMGVWIRPSAICYNRHLFCVHEEGTLTSDYTCFSISDTNWNSKSGNQLEIDFGQSSHSLSNGPLVFLILFFSPVPLLFFSHHAEFSFTYCFIFSLLSGILHHASLCRSLDNILAMEQTSFMDGLGMLNPVSTWEMISWNPF